MGVPIFIPLSFDDKLWLYDATKEEHALALSDPNKWFDQNISATCKRSDIMLQVNTVTLPKDRSFQLCGICGTGIILANGSSVPAPLDTLRSLLDSKDDPETKAEMELLNTDPTKYIGNLDHRLTMVSGLKPTIEVAVHLDKFFGCVHVDFGYFKPFTKVMAVAAISHKNEFAQWLASPTFQRLDRTVTFYDSKGIVAKKDLSSASKFTGGKARVMQFHLDGEGCTGECKLSSCNVDTGDVSRYGIREGLVEMDLEAMLFKIYCRNPVDNSLCM